MRLSEWGYASEVTSYYDPTLPILPRLLIYAFLILLLVYLINAYRKRNSRIMARLSIFAGILFLGRLLVLFPSVITTTDTPGIYLLLTIAELIFLFITLFYLYKYVKIKNLEALTNIEIATAMVQLISMILLLLSTIRGFSVFFIVSGYLGYTLLFLGGFTYFKTKHRICISFITWGIFILLWVANFYYGVYTTGSYT
jgi:hypothetical protein